MKKIAIVCNSTNSDLVTYFKCKIAIFEPNILVLKNKQITLDHTENVFDSSSMSKAFLDKYIIMDFFRSFYIFYIVLIKRSKVIHFTTAHVSNIFLGTLLKPFSIRQIYTIHDLSPHPGKKSFFIRLYNKYIINLLADEIISFSRSDIEKEEQKYKFRYFPLSGFESKIVVPKTGKRSILFFGRMESYKGFDNLFDLIKMSNSHNLNYTFVLAGKGFIPNKEALESLDNVQILNRFISDDELAGLFKNAAFTILPYDSATQSGVSILSYAYATPVIAYDVGALGEYIDNMKSGFLVEYKDNKSIVDILKGISDEAIKNLSENTIREFQEKYSKDACKELYSEYYKKHLEAV